MHVWLDPLLVRPKYVWEKYIYLENCNKQLKYQNKYTPFKHILALLIKGKKLMKSKNWKWDTLYIVPTMKEDFFPLAFLT